jgi:hypothetical protein
MLPSSGVLKTVLAATGACRGSGWYISCEDVQGRLPLHYVSLFSEDVQGRLPLHYVIVYLGLNRLFSEDVQGRLPLLYVIVYLGLNRLGLSAVATDLGYPHRIYIIPTHDTHQCLLIQFLVLLMMVAESVRNMYSNLAVTNKHTAKVASCWFFI